jgi:uncharacterized protein
MNQMLDLIRQPWPWYVSGLIISFIMFMLLFFGKSFGFSSNLRTICSAAGAGKHVSFFHFDWKKQTWNLVFLIGALAGGYISAKWLTDGNPVMISQSTVSDLSQLGFSPPVSLQPNEIFGTDQVFTFSGFTLLAMAGLLIGFGSRYAGGCTSGHAISGMSDLQLPSLIAVIGFFIGGLLMTHLLMPLIF